MSERLRSISLAEWNSFESSHSPGEADGGYIECSCGWPSRGEWEAGVSYVAHIAGAYLRFVESRHE